MAACAGGDGGGEVMVLEIPEKWEGKHDVAFSLVIAFAGLVFVAMYEYNPDLYMKKGAVIAVHVLVVLLIICGVLLFLERLFWAPTAVVLCLVLCGFYDANAAQIFIKKGTITTTEWVAFISAAITFSLFALRTEYQIKQIEAQGEQIKMQNRQITIQEKQKSNQEFDSAVALLGSSEASGRSVAIYSLYNLAVNYKEYRVQIAQILCSHIRAKTREKVYQKENIAMPSNEIQTAINLLFRKESGLEGLYCQFQLELPRADLSNSYLVGAKFFRALIQAVNFEYATCIMATFSHSKCQGAVFYNALLQGAQFDNAKCQGAFFHQAQCLDSNFCDSECQGADFGCVMYKNAGFHGANLEGAYAYLGVTSSLAERIEKNTALETMNPHYTEDDDKTSEFRKFRQKVKEDEELDGGREKMKGWCEKMEELVSSGGSERIYFDEPKEGSKGVLRDSPELRSIIDLLEKIGKWSQNP